MKTNLFVSLLILMMLFLSACAGSAPKTTDAVDVNGAAKQVAQVAEEQPSRKTKVCKHFKPTGSRIGKKVCRTKEAWDEIERIAQRRLDESTKPQSNNPTGQ